MCPARRSQAALPKSGPLPARFLNDQRVCGPRDPADKTRPSRSRSRVPNIARSRSAGIDRDPPQQIPITHSSTPASGLQPTWAGSYPGQDLTRPTSDTHSYGPDRERGQATSVRREAGDASVWSMAEFDEPLSGGCMCGAVRFEVSAPFVDAGICHCKRCQIRSGQGQSFSAIAEDAAVRITSGRVQLRVSPPENGNPVLWRLRRARRRRPGGRAAWHARRSTPGAPALARMDISTSALAPLTDDGLRRYERRRPS